MKNTRLILLICLLSGCATDFHHERLKIATDATFAPFHFIDGSGQVTGFDVELAETVARNAGLEPEIVVLDYADLFTGLTENTHDLVAATTGITEERKQRYRFSRPYFTTCQVAVVRSGPGEPQVLADLQGRRVGASGSGTSATAMMTLDSIHVVIEDGSGTDALLTESIDAWIVDEFDGVIAARESGGKFRVLSSGVTLEQYGLVMARNAAALQKRVDRSLAELDANGTPALLRARYGVNRDVHWPVRCDSL